MDFSPRDVFDLMVLFDATPAAWQQSLKMKEYVVKYVFSLQDHIQLVLKNQRVPIEKAVSKSVYGELISKLITLPTAQLRYNEFFKDANLEWKKIYSLPFRVALDTKSREFQYRILNRYLTTNTFLEKIGKINKTCCRYYIWQ